MSKGKKSFKSGGAEGSSYWSWIESHSPYSQEGHPIEAKDANPDQLSEEDTLIHKSELTDEQEEQVSAYYKAVSSGALRKLAPRQREIWKLRFFKWFSEEEIAQQLNLSLSAVRTHLARAANKFRIEIEKQQKKKQMLDGNYFNDGFKKKIQSKGEATTDKEFSERLVRGQAEIDAFCKKHPELRED